MPILEYTRSHGQRRTYTIAYDEGEYFIQHNNQLKKAVPDPLSIGIAPHEAKAPLMLRMAIADIEALLGMDE